jgi:2,4-dichlorophenol 6-monooxygenase
MVRTVETEVLVVGAGPAGGAAAVFLSHHGVANLVISRHRSTAETPRAHITNQRAMEALRDAGLERDCMAHASPGEFIEHSFWLRSMVGEELARTWAWGNDPMRKGEYEAASPCRMCDLPQTQLEPILVAEAARLGSNVRFNTELVSFEQDDAGVTAQLRDRLTGETWAVRAKYMIGADGARSRVVEQLGIPLTGKHGLGNAFNVVVDVDLTSYVAHRRASLYSTIQPGSSKWAPVGVFRMVRPWDRWLVGLIVPQAAGMPDPTPEEFEQRIREIIGDPAIPLEILSTSVWTINDVVAEHYSVGRVYCMGDAVHRHPPTNGLGSNTCVQDAFNLAWKLALVVQGKANPALLESYEAERQPVGRQIVARANRSMLQNNTVWDLLGGGTRTALAPDEHTAVFETPEGRATLRENIALMKFEYHAHGVEMNRSYASGAVVDDGGPPPAYERDPELYYQPTTRPGASLPHLWLGRRLPGPKVSTLDVAGKRRFTLFTGPGGEAWAAAARDLSEETGVEIHAVSIGPHLDYEDLYGRWAELSGIEENGCVLVRPDLHVGWRCAKLPADPHGALAGVMRSILGLAVAGEKRSAPVAA